MIAAYSQLLVKGYSGQLDNEASICIDFITQGTKRMRELLADLLAYTRLTGEVEETAASIDLNDVFLTVVDNCKAAIDETGDMSRATRFRLFWAINRISSSSSKT